MVNEIYNIDIKSLMHHPANPRTDIGDITEELQTVLDGSHKLFEEVAG